MMNSDPPVRDLPGTQTTSNGRDVISPAGSNYCTDTAASGSQVSTGVQTGPRHRSIAMEGLLFMVRRAARCVGRHAPVTLLLRWRRPVLLLPAGAIVSFAPTWSRS